MSKYNKVTTVTIGNDDGENVHKNSLTTGVLDADDEHEALGECSLSF